MYKVGYIMEQIEIVAKTIEDAIAEGLKQIEMNLEDVTITILKQPGMFSKAKIKISFEKPQAIKLDEPLTQTSVKNNQLNEAEKIDNNNDKEFETEQASDFQSLDEKIIATTILENIICELNIDAKITQSAKGKVILLEVKGDSLGALIGRGGENIDSLQLLLNNILRVKTPLEKRRIILHIGDYQIQKEKKIRELANVARAKCLEINKTVRMDPMNSYERRLVHDELNKTDDIVCESFGVEPYRYVTVRPNDEKE